MQLQDAAVARATKLVEESHAKLPDFAGAREHFAGEIDRTEELRNRVQDAGKRDQLEGRLAASKRELEPIAKDEHQWQGKASAAEQQLKDEQIKLAPCTACWIKLDPALEHEVIEQALPATDRHRSRDTANLGR